jgi:hypothetical protein
MYDRPVFDRPVFVFDPFSPESIILDWPAGLLESATNPSGPWQPLGGTPPLTNPALQPEQFFRLKLQ